MKTFSERVPQPDQRIIVRFGPKIRMAGTWRTSPTPHLESDGSEYECFPGDRWAPEGAEALGGEHGDS